MWLVKLICCHTKDDNQVTGPHSINTKRAINPSTTPWSWVEYGDASWPPHLPIASSSTHPRLAALFWRQNMKHLVEADRGLVLHDRRTSAWELHYIPAVERAVALSTEKNTPKQQRKQVRQVDLPGNNVWQMEAGCLDHGCSAGKSKREKEILEVVVL